VCIGHHAVVSYVRGTLYMLEAVVNEIKIENKIISHNLK
jgi:hypothetical protein